jgi:hypothetical protein
MGDTLIANAKAATKEATNMMSLMIDTIKDCVCELRDGEYYFLLGKNKGSTKRTLCGIVLFKLNTFFSHVIAGP